MLAPEIAREQRFHDASGPGHNAPMISCKRAHSWSGLFAAALATFGTAACSPADDPPPVAIKESHWSDLSLENVKPGDWVEYEVAAKDGKPAIRCRTALLKSAEDGYLVQTASDGDGLAGWVLLAWLSKPGKHVKDCWIGRPGKTGHPVKVEHPAPRSEADREAGAKRMKELSLIGGPRKVKLRRGEIWLEKKSVGSREVACERVVLETTWDYSITGNPVEVETSWWSAEVPSFRRPDFWWLRKDVIWRDVQASWGGLVRSERGGHPGVTEESLVGFGHNATQELTIPESR
ncbi:MAG: hypothetical protein AAB074_10580 [Planctomycetota bacterium]